jgi:hypothetical protein
MPASRCLHLYLFGLHIRPSFAKGNDFTEEGFASIIEYLYTGDVVGVTCGILNCDKLQAALQAAQYFDMMTLDTAARSWAQTTGATVEASSACQSALTSYTGSAKLQSVSSVSNVSDV